MDKEICKTVIERKKVFVPSLFTVKQVNLMDKYLKHEILNNTERTYLYSTIKKKLDALRTLKEELYINGNNMIPKRMEKAKNIIKEINKKAFISGSFLYKKDYEDIDIYVISKRRKSYHKDNKHFIFITEKMLENPVFYSSLKYSVANFSTKEIKPIIKRKRVDELLFTYQWVINQILDNEDQKELRDLIFQYYLQTKKKVLDSYSLYCKTKEIKNLSINEEIKKINQITKDILLKTHSKKYLYNAISKFSKDIKRIGKEYKTNNIPIFLGFAQEVKDECRRTEK